MCETVTSTQSRQAFRITARYNSSQAYRCYVREGDSVWDTKRYADKHWIKFCTNSNLNVPQTCRMGISHHGRPCRIKVSVTAVDSSNHDGKWFRLSESVSLNVPSGSFQQLHLDIGDCKLVTFDCISITLSAVEDNQKIRPRLCGVDWGIRSPIYTPPHVLRQNQMEFLGRCNQPYPVLNDENGTIMTQIGFETPNMDSKECSAMALEASAENGLVNLTYDMGRPYPCATYMVLTTPRCEDIDMLAYTPLHITLSTSDTGTGWDVIYNKNDGPMWCSDGEEQRIYSFPPSQAYVSPRFYKLCVSGMLTRKLLLGQFGLAICGRTSVRVEPLQNYLMYDMSNRQEYACDNLVRTDEQLRVPPEDKITLEFNMGDEVSVGAVRFAAMAISNTTCHHDGHIGKMDISAHIGPSFEWTSVCSSMMFSSKFETTLALSHDVFASRWRVRIQNICGFPISVCGLVLLETRCDEWNKRERCEKNKFMLDMNLIKSILTNPKRKNGPYSNMPMTMLILTLYSLCKSKREFIESLQSITEKGIMCSDGASIGSASDNTTHPLIHWIPSEPGMNGNVALYASTSQTAEDAADMNASDTCTETATMIAPASPNEAECSNSVHSYHPHASCPVQHPPYHVQQPPLDDFDALQMRKETPLHQEHNNINERLTYYDSLLDMELKSSATLPSQLMTGS